MAVEGISKVQPQGNSGKTVKNTGKSISTADTGTGVVQSEATVKTTGGIDGSVPEGVRYDVSAGASRTAAWWRELAQQDTELPAEEGTEKTKEKTGESEDDPMSEDEKTLHFLEKMLERLRERKRTETSKDQVKRSLSYSYRKISVTIGRAKSVAQASNALSSANTNLSAVRRKAASGKYDEDEIRIAMQHARKMVRVARKKVRNLKQELQQGNQNEHVEMEKKRETIQLKQPERSKTQIELQQLQKVLRQAENMEKTGNRRRENRDLMAADIEYLRRAIELLRREKTVEEQNTVLSQQTTPETIGMTGIPVEGSNAAEQVAAEQVIAENSGGGVTGVSGSSGGAAGMDVTV